MINLTPISRNIQTRLFEKVQALGREAFSSIGQVHRALSGYSNFTNEKLTNRTTFLRMTSGLRNPVILVNGELDAMSQVAAGYKDIYSSRVGYDRERNADYEWSIDESLKIGDIDQETADEKYEGADFTRAKDAISRARNRLKIISRIQ